MKRLSLLLLLVCAATVVTTRAASRDAQWRAVNEAVNQGLPRTAIDRLEPIVQAALQDRAYGEAAKAIARRIVLEGTIQGNKPEEKITRMAAEIAKAPKEIVPLLQTIQANWYWHYFQNNRWRFLRRTATSQPPGNDFTTWDLPRLFAEIDRQFQQALSNADTLKATPIGTFDDLLEKGTVPDTYRPTLYDFIAHEALQFHTSGEQAGAKPDDAFEISADSPIFDDAAKFIAWAPTGISPGQRQSAALQAIRLFQDLMKFHQNDTDPSAFIDVDLARLSFGFNTAFGENKNARYQAALKAVVDKWADHPLSATALSQWARLAQSEDNLVEARLLALRGANAFPNSIGGRLCRNLVTQIEARSAGISTERVWNCGPRGAGTPVSTHDCPVIEVRYRNLTNLHFRAVAYDWDVFLDRRHSRPESLNEAERRELLAKAPALTWSAPLPPTPDFRERLEELPAPNQLKAGFYFLIASPDPGFTDQNNQVWFTDVWVSDLALVLRPRSGNVEGFVLEANSGEPVSGAEIMAWHLDNQGNRVPRAPATTDENGFFSFKSEPNRSYLIRARHQGRELGSQQEYAGYQREPYQPQLQTVFFTDRAIYRPGQTIQYKGISLRVDQDNNNYQVLAGRELTVVFSDPNNKEIARREHRCNDYGSFNGSFTAPSDRLLGAMRIYVSNGPGGQANFNVEEYKRPKFRTTLDAPKTGAKLNERVSVTGHATSYTGAAVDGAEVRYRVVREVRWPYWWGWYYSWRGPRVQGSQEIAHGTGRTATDGSFTVEFTARPDPQVSENDEASFSFTLFADVTDTTGETRSAERSVQVGFTALTATLSAEEWQTTTNAVELKVSAATLDGEPQVAEGSVKIYRLQDPARVQRARLTPIYFPFRAGDGGERPKPDLSDPNNWEPGEVAAEKGFTTATNGQATISFNLGAGVYRAMLETRDRFGKKVTARLPVQVLNPDDTRFAIKIPHALSAPDWSLEPGSEFMALWGTGYDTGRAFVEIEHRQKVVQRFWTKPGQTQQQIRQAVTESMRGGFMLHVTQVRENRAYFDSRHVEVPWSNKDFDLKWEHFTSKLEPAQKETWTAVIQSRHPQSATNHTERAVAEMVATLYDASLDQFRPLTWLRRFAVFHHDYSFAQPGFENTERQFQWLKGGWTQEFLSVDLRYRQFPADLIQNLELVSRRYGLRPNTRGLAAGRTPEVDSLSSLSLADTASLPAEARGEALGFAKTSGLDPGVGGGANPPPTPDLGSIVARRNLNETAFFFPHLLSDSNGVVRMQFTMPEALTEWRFLGFAHDKSLRSGFLDGKAVTSRELMVQPNPPRFLREGDTIEFTVKVSNQSDARQTGTVRLTFNQALGNQSADKLLGNTSPDQQFDIAAKESKSFSWRISVPDDIGFLTYKAVGSSGRISDGEEGFLPVLSRRVLITESLPLPIRGPATRKFEFTKLLKSGGSKTLRNQNLVVQMASNPAWYAVLALPYLMEFPHECTEQTFNRFYANSLARHIANSDPKIHRVFEQWRNTPALDSPLEKNQDLKSVMLEETPWLRQAKDESQARRNIGVLFDDNRLNNESARVLQKLAEMQLEDGSWPWFPGGRGNDFMTLYITTGFGRLRHLGADVRVQPAVKALSRLDTWMDERYREIQKSPKPQDYVPSSIDALGLYGRSFFLKDRPVAAAHRPALDFFLAQARKHWVKVNNRQSQAHLALALKRFAPAGSPQDPASSAIMRSIKERAVTSEEMGMFWRDTEASWWWYRAPIETQAQMIEAFDEVMNDAKTVEDCKVWLLKQKQTQDWKTTKATADAVYALLLRGNDLLSSDRLVEIKLGGIEVTPGRGADRKSEVGGQKPVEAGTGFFERRFTGAEIKPKMGGITVRKLDSGVAWGGVHWQYLEDLSQVTPHEGTPLKLKKSLFTKANTNRGPVLEPVKGAVRVGDELTVRIELRVDRDMEFVHLKDQRGSGTEPVNVLSGYRYQDGLAYYESTRDTASHFFIDYLPKGTYVFEYSTRVQLRGQYQTGVAEIQCMYAPEFNSHSESVELTVQ